MPGVTSIGALADRARLTLDDHLVWLGWSCADRLALAPSTGELVVLQDGAEKRAWVPHAGGTDACGWSCDGRFLATGGQDGVVSIWTPEGTRITDLDAGGGWVEQLAWHPRRPLLATAAGRVLRVWSSDGKLLREWRTLPSTIAGLAWSHAGNALGVVAYGVLVIVRPEQPETQPQVLPWKGSLIALAWSPNDRFIATGLQEGAVHAWRSDGSNHWQMPGYPRKPAQLAWERSSRSLATGGGHDIVIWNFTGAGPGGRTPRLLTWHRDFVVALAQNPAAPILASSSRDGHLLLWKREEPHAGAVLASEPVALGWNREGTRLAAGCANGDVAVF